jgi:hypothetical protein
MAVENSRKPTIVVLLAPPDAGMSSALISEAAMAEMPLAVPECVFEFVIGQDFDLQFTVMPISGTVGSVETPGGLFERPPTEAELAQARAALDAIIRRVRLQKPS